MNIRKTIANLTARNGKIKKMCIVDTNKNIVITYYNNIRPTLGLAFRSS